MLNGIPANITQKKMLYGIRKKEVYYGWIHFRNYFQDHYLG